MILVDVLDNRETVRMMYDMHTAAQEKLSRELAVASGFWLWLLKAVTKYEETNSRKSKEYNGIEFLSLFAVDSPRLNK